jgi:hypothetical protein
MARQRVGDESRAFMRVTKSSSSAVAFALRPFGIGLG